MPATRFLRRGVTKVRFAATLTAPDAVTFTEWSTAVDLSPQIADFGGWNVANSPITTPDLVDTYDGQIPGVDASDTSTLTLYDLKEDPDPIKVALAKDETGYILIAPKGEAALKPLEAWPVTVASRSNELSLGNDPARYVATFSIPARPVTDGITIPAGP